MATTRNTLQLIINGKNNAGAALGKLTQQLAVVGAAAAAAFGLAVTKAAEFQRGMAEISTLLDGDTSQAIDAMSKELLDLSVEFGQAIDKMVKARYDIVSAGFTDAAESAALMRASTKLAVAGVSDVATTADLLTTALNANGLSYEYVDAVSDVLFQTVRKGKTTIDQLGASLGNVFATAAVAGVDIREVAASMAVLTASGINTNESVTALNGLLNALGAPSSEAAEKLEELGITLDDGLQPALVALADVGEDGLDALKQFIPNIRALKAAAVAAKDVDAFNQALDDMYNATGVVNEGVDKMRDTLSFAKDQFKAAMDALRISVGEVALPVLTDLTRNLANVIDTARENRDAIFEAAQQLANFGIQAAKIGFGLLALKSVFGLLRAATFLLNKQMLILIAAFIGFLGFVKLTGNVWDDILRGMANIRQIQGPLSQWFGIDLREWADNAELLQNALKGDSEAIRQVASMVPGLTTMLDLLKDSTKDVGEASDATQKALSDMANSAVAMQTNLAKSTTALKDFVDQIRSLAQIMREDVSSILFSIGDQFADMFTDATTALVGLTEGPILIGRAFKQMAVSVISDIARIIARALIARTILRALNMDLQPGGGAQPGFFGALFDAGSRALLGGLLPFKSPVGLMRAPAGGFGVPAYAGAGAFSVAQLQAMQRAMQPQVAPGLDKLGRRHEARKTEINLNISRPFRTSEQLDLVDSVQDSIHRTRRYQA